MQSVETYEEAGAYLEESDHNDALEQYWRKSQPALANAVSLVQQAMEMALKGRIAAISPYLLIARDPKDWPKGSENGDVPFSEFRTLDAADLLKVHNTFSQEPLDEDFRVFWDQVRRDRNKVMHSVAPRTFDAATLTRSILLAVKWLFSNKRWPQHLIDMEESGTNAALGVYDFTYNIVMRHIDIAIKQLAPVDRRKLLGVRTNQRSYLCPTCHESADRDFQDDWPHLAQLRSRRKGEKILDCILCEAVIEVSRSACTQYGCRGDTIYQGMCLTCHGEQDDPTDFHSGLASTQLGSERQYHLEFDRLGLSRGDLQWFSDDEAAKEHARLALLAPHLSSWNSAIIQTEVSSREFSPFGRKRRTIGLWRRSGDELCWEAGCHSTVDEDATIDRA
jgi:hypothetical protein